MPRRQARPYLAVHKNSCGTYDQNEHYPLPREARILSEMLFQGTALSLSRAGTERVSWTITQDSPSVWFLQILLDTWHRIYALGFLNDSMFDTSIFIFKMVPETRFELVRSFEYWILNPGRLPVPPLRYKMEPAIGIEPTTF